MHPYTPMAILLAVIACCFSAPPDQPATQTVRPEPAAPGIAVVELFTSEGCSSCPPADRVLTDLHRDSQKSGARVYILSFHVDYWDSLGWPDPFASKEATDRQATYRDALKVGSLYTPQMVVNGATEFVGSKAAQARKAVADALTTPIRSIDAKLADRAGKGPLVVTLSAPNCPNASVTIAVTQDGLSSAVTRGENSGRTLTHDGVVRVFTTVTLDEHGIGSATLNPPADLIEENARLVAFAQDATNRRVLAATALPITQTPASK